MAEMTFPYLNGAGDRYVEKFMHFKYYKNRECPGDISGAIAWLNQHELHKFDASICAILATRIKFNTLDGYIAFTLMYD
jgi:hypothetical protein